MFKGIEIEFDLSPLFAEHNSLTRLHSGKCYLCGSPIWGKVWWHVAFRSKIFHSECVKKVVAI